MYKVEEEKLIHSLANAVEKFFLEKEFNETQLKEYIYSGKLVFFFLQQSQKHDFLLLIK